MITVLVLPRFFLQPAIRVSSFHGNPINFWLQMQAEQFRPRLRNMKSIFVDLEKFEISPYHSESLCLIFTIKIKTKILKEKKILAEDKTTFYRKLIPFFIVFFKDKKDFRTPARLMASFNQSCWTELKQKQMIIRHPCLNKMGIWIISIFSICLD